MRSVLLTTLLTGALAGSVMATTTDQMMISSGGTTVTITDGGAGDLSPTAGTIVYQNLNFNGWVISFTAGSSNSPTLTPYGIDVSSLTATCASSAKCAAGGANSLKIDFSDINFNVPVGPGGFVTDYSSTQTGGGSTSETAWFSNSNTIFSKSNLIGTVGPFTSTNHGSAQGGGPGIPPYSLTLEEVFTDTTGGSVSFSVDGNITATPEPAAIVFLATAALGIGLLFRRKAANNLA